MTLEFNKIVQQVYNMGAMLDKLDFDITDSLALARERFLAAGDLGRVWERIEWVRSSEISHYRGAAPPDLPDAEPINSIIPPPAPPTYATIIAADGSQVYPDELAPVHYYLLNVGLYVYYHSQGTADAPTPEQYTYPKLFFHREHVHDRYGRIISNGTVDDRRTVAELKRLAQTAWERRSPDLPLIALYDNRLLYLPGNDAHESDDLMSEYLAALVHMQDAGATLAGYIDNPFRAKRFMQLLFLMSIETEAELKARQVEISRSGDLEGLRDQQFFYAILENGERSAIMVQNSPQNKLFRDRGKSYEIAFFYLKVHNSYQSKVVRVDIPMWVARDKVRVDALHALLLHQCQLQGRNPYPYAITRADELAWIGSKDRSKLDELVNVEVRRIKEDLVGRTLTAKMRGKELARSEKRYHNMLGEEIIDDR
ncbi:DNA double-strand break repair nuclease NurA [Phototrophicus methaneseepsis]|uniref:DNA double-strand break repair nuclease NurA n=1 Tax=Phototrophicus methaneseepsis TaxID=2710758 RepID=A0A7S8E8F0_9CHLR|nr:DNA double-strand break repair nuclease NurA [Phototrophicus methaneseepsis]QPC82300.1 DNA double-strand break repair nuclease NurA [Phototrophicus methaneseepsis]